MFINNKLGGIGKKLQNKEFERVVFLRCLWYNKFDIRMAFYYATVLFRAFDSQIIFFMKECFKMTKYVCPCGYVYDPEVGDPDNGIAPGTPWEEVPEDFVCPVCGLGKDMFEAE